MTPNSEKKHNVSVVVEVSPCEVEVDAGADVTLNVRVSCLPALDLRGQTLLIRDQDGAEVGRAELTEFDGETTETGEFVVKAPAKVGAYAWSVVCPAATDDISYEEAEAPISITVKSHTSRIVVWGIPSAIGVGEKFSLKVGIKCSSGCRLTGREFGIYDHEGAQVATGALGGDHWPGSTAMYFGEVELEAPDTEGLHRWQAKAPAAAVEVPGSEVAIPHEERSTAFGVTFVPPPECLVRIEAVDKDKQTPLKGARVVLHPYRAVTDDRGVAEVRVPKGQYKLLVSRSKYRAIGVPVEVAGDMATTAELDLEPEDDLELY